MKSTWVLLCLTAQAAFAANAVVDVVEKSAPLVEAVHAGDDARALALLTGAEHADANQTSSDGTTALHWAVYRNDVSLVDRLLAGGANANAKNASLQTSSADAKHSKTRALNPRSKVTKKSAMN